MRLYELDAAALHPINCVTAGDVMRGATLVPRHGLDRAGMWFSTLESSYLTFNMCNFNVVIGNEVARLLKLTDK
jgi:hypothetical protein